MGHLITHAIIYLKLTHKVLVCNFPIGSRLQTKLDFSTRAMMWEASQPETHWLTKKTPQQPKRDNSAEGKGAAHSMAKLVQWLQSGGESPLPPLFQNRACGFPRTRLLSEVVVVTDT